MNLVWLLRARRWLAHPPAPGRLALVAVVVALCLALFAAEQLGLWPEGLGRPQGLGVKIPQR